MSERQQCVSSHQHLYKKKQTDWKSDLRKNIYCRLTCTKDFQSFVQRLRDERQEIFSRVRSGLACLETDLFVGNILQDEIKALRLSEHITDDELNEAIQEFERFRDEIVQQEIESMTAYERERLEDLASGYDSVLCPRCQFCNLNFPDEHSMKCEHCELQLSLAQPLSPQELATYFTKIFTSHFDRGARGIR